MTIYDRKHVGTPFPSESWLDKFIEGLSLPDTKAAQTESDTKAAQTETDTKAAQNELDTKAAQTGSDSWVSIPEMQKERSHRRPRRQAFLVSNCTNSLSPAAVSKPIDIPGSQMPLYMSGSDSYLPEDHPFTDHKVHCYKDNVTDYCRRDINDGWEFARQKRRKRIEAQVGKISGGSWELVVASKARLLEMTDDQVQEREFDEIERYLNGETNLLGYLEDTTKEMDDEEGEDN